MNRRIPTRQRQSGGSLIEILVTLVILMIGLLGLIGLSVQSQRSQMESYQRVQALIILDDMVNRINTNRKAAPCYVITSDPASGAPYLGTGSVISPTCSTGTLQQQTLAIQDMTEWNDALLGIDEKDSTGTNVGGILGARGCVEQVSAGLYRVSVVWQGNSKTFAPAGITCGTGLYGEDTYRRGVSVDLRIATLS